MTKSNSSPASRHRHTDDGCMWSAIIAVFMVCSNLCNFCGLRKFCLCCGGFLQ